MGHLYSVPVVLAVVGVEAIYSRFKKPQAYGRNDTLANLFLGLTYLVLSSFTAIALYYLYSWLHTFRLFDIPKTALSFWLLVVLDDFCGYWSHRFSHEVRFLWSAHHVHHSSELYNFSTSARLSIFSLLLTWPFWLPLVFLGFPIEWIFIVGAISHFYGIFSHTLHVQRLGFLEYFLTTPSHHRVHHGSDTKYLDRNYAVIFIVWDKLFGTFQVEEEEPHYGVVTPIETENPLRVLFYPWISLYKDLKSAPDLKAAWNYLSQPPGWNHLGTGITSEKIRQELKESAAVS